MVLSNNIYKKYASFYTCYSFPIKYNMSLLNYVYKFVLRIEKYTPNITFVHIQTPFEIDERKWWR